MKKLIVISYVFLVGLNALCLAQQCNIEAGDNQTIFCSMSAKLHVEPKWSKLNTGTGSSLRSISFPTIDTGYAAGLSTLLQTTNGGQNWTLKSTGNNTSVSSIYFTSAQTGFMGGVSTIAMKGVILKTMNGGANWAQTIIDSSFSINSIYFINADTGYAVGNPGVILKTTDGGNLWIKQKSHTTGILFSVHFVNTNVGFAVGDGGIILKTINAGITWTSVTSGIVQNLRSVWLTTADTCYAAGEGNVILKTTNGGNNWSSLPVNNTTNVTYSFQSIRFTGADTGFAIALYNRVSAPLFNNGAIFKTSNGGLAWDRLNTDTSNYLYAGCFASSNTFYAAGENGTILRSPVEPDSCVWWPAYGLDSTNIKSPTANPTSTTTYVVTATTNGCVATDTITVFVKPLAVNAGEDRSVVCGDSTRLVLNNVFIDISASRYGSSWVIKDTNDKVWLSSVAEKDTSCFVHLPDGRYSFVCKPKVLPPPLRIRILPFIQDSISETIYFTTDTVITRNFTVATPTKYTVTWFPAQSLIGPASVTTKYNMMVTTPEGCQATDSINITPVPVLLNAGTNKTIICGAVARFDTLTSNYSGAEKLNYKWFPSTGLNNDTASNPVSKVNSTVDYVVTVSDNIGCNAKDTVKVIVNPLIISGTGLNLRCGDTARLNTTVNYTGTDTLSYLWSPASGLNKINIPDPIVTAISQRVYTVIVSTPNGCTATDTLNVAPIPLHAINICLAGVNAANKNEIIWNKPLSTVIDSFYVYRETNITGVYNRTGILGYNQLSTFTDTNSFPDIQSNKYRISIKDQCGLESSAGEAHKTMHLTINKGTGNTWNLIWGAYEGFIVSTYNVYRGTGPSDLTLIGTSSGSNTQYTDLTAPEGDVYYQVEVVSPNACTISKSSNTSRSNISTNKVNGITENAHAENLFSMYPNPSAAMFTLVVNTQLAKEYVLYIYDMKGVLVRTAKFSQNRCEVNTDDLHSGIYVVEVKSGQLLAKEKLVIQR